MAGILWLGITLLALLFLPGCGSVLTPVPQPTNTPTITSLNTFATPTVALGAYFTPIPPTATLTPAPTPTPAIHVVQSGETLLGIALEYGLSLAALQAANGIDNPQYLRVGQALIIPTAQETPEPVFSGGPLAGNFILPTPTPMPLSIEGIAYYSTPLGGVWVMGNIVNTSDQPVSNLQAQIALLDGQGNLLATNTVLAAADYLLPGARAPFAHLFPHGFGGPLDVRASLIRAEIITGITMHFTALGIREVNWGVSGPQYRVTGIVYNDAAYAVERVAVVATLYTAEGQVMGYRKLVLPQEQLAAGSALSFELLLTPQGATVPADVDIIAWGTRVE